MELVWLQKRYANVIICQEPNFEVNKQ